MTLILGYVVVSVDWTLQRVVFADPMRRSDLPAVPVDSERYRELRIAVVRNEACEPGLALAARCARYAGLAITWHIGPYDDTLGPPPSESVEDPAGTPRWRLDSPWDGLIAWIDWRRMDHGAQALVARRLDGLRALMDGPLAVIGPSAHEEPAWADFLVAWVERTPDVWLAPLDELVDPIELRDPRLAAIAGSDLSGRASAALARWIGVTFAGSIGAPPLKCIAVDLDGTLHQGVLGEDGITGVLVTDAHYRLGAELKALRARGVLLAIVTKNDPADVEALMRERTDLALGHEDLIAVCASWDPKPVLIEGLAMDLGISPDAIALLDDNPGELAAAQAAGIWPIDGSDPIEAVRVLQALPRVRSIDRTAGTREADFRARAERARQGRGPNPGALHEELGTRMTVLVGTEVDLDRFADLLARTNQFNCTLARTSRAALDRLITNPVVRVATARVQDRLSDSGVIAALLLSRDEGKVWKVSEFVLSCRILGRGLEGAIFRAMCEAATSEVDPEIEVPFVEGPRNEPARRWHGEACPSGRMVVWRPADRELARSLVHYEGAQPPSSG